MDKITYALKDGQLVSINDVESGLACNCICPACHQKLIAKKGKINIHHFAHYSTESCEHAYESSLHLMAKDIFQNADTFTIPRIMFGNYGPICLEEKRNIKIKNVYLEQTVNDMKPDVIVEDEDGNKYFIEIYVTHKIDENKLAKIQGERINTLEYDLSKVSKIHNLLTYEELSEILLGDSIIPKWIYHHKIEEAKQLYGMPSGKVVFCEKQRGYRSKWIYCLTDCGDCIDISDDEKTLYCKNASELRQTNFLYCPECGKKLSLIKGRYGSFWGCPNWPKCTHTEDY